MTIFTVYIGTHPQIEFKVNKVVIYRKYARRHQVLQYKIT